MSHKPRTGEDEHAFIRRHGTLVFIHSTDGHERISVANLPEGPHTGLGIQILGRGIHMVRFSRIHPPSIHAEFENTLIQVFPINVTGFGRIGVIHFHSGRIFHDGRPCVNPRGRPSTEVKQQSFGSQFPVRFRSRTESRPNGNSHVGIHRMHIVQHLLGIRIIWIQKSHGVPQIVVPPILPILNNAVERYTQITIFTHYVHHLFLAFVTFLALPITISPKRKHRYLSRKITHLRYNAIGITAIHEIIIHAIAHLRTERSLFLIVGKDCGGIIVPEEAIPLGRLDEWTYVFHVTLYKILHLPTLGHLPVLQLS